MRNLLIDNTKLLAPTTKVVGASNGTQQFFTAMRRIISKRSNI